MKKALIILAIVAVIGFAVWYFILNKPTVTLTTTAPTTPGSSGTGSSSEPVLQTVGEVNIPTGGGVTNVDVDHANETVLINSGPVAIAPDLSLLRSKNWNATIYKGALNINDTAGFNYLTSFAPVSNALALVEYNNEEAFEAKACGASATSCQIFTVSKSAFPFKITYGATNSLESFVSGDYKTIILLDGNNIIKKLSESDGVVVTQGESVEVQSVPVASELNLKNWNVEMFGASIYRYDSGFKDFMLNFNPMIGLNQGVRVIPNNWPDLEGLFCRKASGDYEHCEKEIITKENFPYMIVYPDRKNSDGSYRTVAYVSTNLRRILVAQIILGSGGDRSGTVRIFKEYTR